jgi:hypothetical protein
MMTGQAPASFQSFEAMRVIAVGIGYCSHSILLSQMTIKVERAGTGDTP